MKKQKVPNVVSLVSSDLKKNLVRFKPIGLARKPSDVMQLLTALRNILTAVVALHKIELMHRDLRWDQGSANNIDCQGLVNLHWKLLNIV
ncbi:hypothetical protein L916_04634 [Phytophthora nicotianae]|uniref:Protein kinase domain-containing protein n=1 Tax=Phytophthora nicotianae TaxID=4792 RepID=W2JI13_PHYNI|nr:hypothetical protein L916_04634 [Phytophthora nicotianae]